MHLPDMLKYLQATQADRIDQVECESRARLNKISNKLVRDVSTAACVVCATLTYSLLGYN
jgi:hypothetical protein